MFQAPFVHKFESHGGTKYVYDVNTNEIFEVEEPLYALIDDLEAAGGDTGRWVSVYGADGIREAVQEIRSLQGRGYFLPSRELRMSSPVCDECVETMHETQSGKLLINVTENCNMRCVYCVFSGLYGHQRSHGTSVMSREVARTAISRFVDETRKSPYNYVSFYGGEPLLHLDRILEMIDFYTSICPEKRTTFHIDTNATLLDDVTIERIVKNDIYLQISLDGPREVHDRYRVTKDGSGTFDTIMRNMQTIRAIDEDYYRMKIGISCTISPPYRLFEIDDFFASGAVPRNTLMCNFVDPHDTDFYRLYCDPDRDMAELTRQLSTLKDRYIEARIEGSEPTAFARSLFEDSIVRLHRRGRTPLGDRFPPNGICAPGIRRFFVSTDGGIYPCERVGTAFKLGTVFDGIDQAKARGIVQEYIENSQDVCSRCWAMRMCGICFALAKRGDRFDFERKKESCQLELVKLHAALQTYVSVMEKNVHAYDFVDSIIVA